MPCDNIYRISIPAVGLLFKIYVDRDGLITKLVGNKNDILNCSKSSPLTILNQNLFDGNDNTFSKETYGSGRFTAAGTGVTFFDHQTLKAVFYKIYSFEDSTYIAYTLDLQVEPSIIKVALYVIEEAEEADDADAAAEKHIISDNSHLGNWDRILKISCPQLLLFGYLFVNKQNEIINVDVNIGENAATLLLVGKFDGNNNMVNKCDYLTYQGLALTTTTTAAEVVFLNLYSENGQPKLDISFTTVAEDITTVVVCDLKIKKVKCL